MNVRFWPTGDIRARQISPGRAVNSAQAMQTELIGTAHEYPIHKHYPGQPRVYGVKIKEHG